MSNLSEILHQNARLSGENMPESDLFGIIDCNNYSDQRTLSTKNIFLGSFLGYELFGAGTFVSEIVTEPDSVLKEITGRLPILTGLSVASVIAYAGLRILKTTHKYEITSPTYNRSYLEQSRAK